MKEHPVLAKVDGSNRVAIPSFVRYALSIYPGDKLKVFWDEKEQKIILTKERPTQWQTERK